MGSQPRSSSLPPHSQGSIYQDDVGQLDSSRLHQFSRRIQVPLSLQGGVPPLGVVHRDRVFPF